MDGWLVSAVWHLTSVCADHPLDSEVSGTNVTGLVLVTGAEALPSKGADRNRIGASQGRSNRQQYAHSQPCQILWLVGPAMMTPSHWQLADLLPDTKSSRVQVTAG